MKDSNADPRAGSSRGPSGSPSYDQIAFSATPLAATLREAGGVAVVRHLGHGGDAIASLHGVSPDRATLTLDLASFGSFVGHIGDRRVDHRLRRGQVNFVPPGMPCGLAYPASHKSLFVSIAVDQLEPRLDGRPAAALEPLVADHRLDVARLMRLLDAEIAAPGFGADLIIDELLQMIFARLRQPARPAAARERLYIAPARLQRVRDYIETNLHRSLTVADLAAVVELSPDHFARVFKLAVGEAPHRYVMARRLARAEDELRRSDTPLAMVALGCGFSSQAHFTAAFQRATRLTPGRYRRLMRPPAV